MELIFNNHILGESLNDAIMDARKDPRYVNWSWAVSVYDTSIWNFSAKKYYDTYKNPFFLDCFLRNLKNGKLKHLYLSGRWDIGRCFGEVESTRNFYLWENKTKFAKKWIGGYSAAHFVQAQAIFHPKVYVFYSDDYSVWKAFIGSANMTQEGLNDNIESVAVLTQEDDKDGTLFQSIMKLFEEDIPLSEHICKNKREKGKILKGKKQSRATENEGDVVDAIVMAVIFLMPAFEGNRYRSSFQILARFLWGENPKEIAESLGKQVSRVDNACTIKPYVRNVLVRAMQSGDEISQEVEKILDDIIGSESYLEYFKEEPKKGRCLTKLKRRWAERKAFLDLLQSARLGADRGTANQGLQEGGSTSV